MVMPKKIDGWKCTKCGQVYDEFEQAEKCCQTSDKVYNYNGRAPDTRFK